jgi:hypothetical protein
VYFTVRLFLSLVVLLLILLFLTKLTVSIIFFISYVCL